MIRAAALLALPGITHGFFTREGGVSTGIYASMNVGIGSADARADVMTNRQLSAAKLGLSASDLALPYQIHSADVIAAFDAFYQDPRCGEVYNLGGGRENSASILECMTMIEQLTGKEIERTYQDRPRRGDHQCYISNLSKMKNHFPNWRITHSLGDMIDEMVEAVAV